MKKLLALILVVVITLGVMLAFTACGDDNSEALAQLQAEVTRLQGLLDQLTNGNNAETIAELEAEVVRLQGLLDAASNVDLDAILARIGALETAFADFDCDHVPFNPAAILAELSDIWDELEVLEGSFDLSAINQELYDIRYILDNITDNGGSIDLSGILTNLSNLEDEIEELQGDIADIQDQLSDIEDELEDLRADVDANALAIHYLLLDIVRLEGFITGHTTTTGNHATAISNIQSTLTTLRSDLTALQNQVNALPAAPALPVVRLGNPFYFYDFGIRLFSLTFFESPFTVSQDMILVNVTNYGFSSLVLGNTIRGAHILNDDRVAFWNPSTATQWTLTHGASFTNMITSFDVDTGYAWIGMQHGITLIPFMILDTSRL